MYHLSTENKWMRCALRALTFVIDDDDEDDDADDDDDNVNDLKNHCGGKTLYSSNFFLILYLKPKPFVYDIFWPLSATNK